jgi:hypothetical protein
MEVARGLVNLERPEYAPPDVKIAGFVSRNPSKDVSSLHGEADFKPRKIKNTVLDGVSRDREFCVQDGVYSSVKKKRK